MNFSERLPVDDAKNFCYFARCNINLSNQKLVSIFMKNKLSVLFSSMLCSIVFAFASNVKIDNAAYLTDQDTINKTVNISFDISWEDSWRQATGYDGVWLFAKYKEKGSKEWKQVYFGASVKDYQIKSDNGVFPDFSIGTTEGKPIGVFAYRKEEGTGNINWDEVKIQWKYSENKVADISNIAIKIFAVEMVYVPKGAFLLGSGGTESCAFYTYPNTTTPFSVSSEDAITIGEKTGQLFYAKHFYSDMYTANVPTEFPKGYNPFWCMKYEITQGEYVDFLNTLTREQQISRVITDISVSKINNFYVMCNDKIPVSRNGIRCDSLVSIADPITFYCDLNANGKPNENNDGPFISCNFLGWADGAAYSDWAGLRPMTEFEYEKACRGTHKPVANEYAWGNTDIYGVLSLLNVGTINECASNSTANCIFDNPASIQGPIKAGLFFKKNNSRQQNGVSFYGIADLSGNLFERCVTVSNSNGAAYKGTEGDGILDLHGNPTNSDWPNLWGAGAGYRGGSYFYASAYCRISDRQYAGLSDHSRFYHYGFRAVRSAE